MTSEIDEKVRKTRETTGKSVYCGRASASSSRPLDFLLGSTSSSGSDFG